MKEGNEKTSALTPSLIADLRKIIEQGRREAYAAVSQVMISTYWNIGKRIVEEEQGGADYAKYGQYLLRDLGEQLCAEYGRGYTKRRLEEYRLFYLSFRNIEIAQTRLRNLTWSHFRIIMREPTPEGRAWYVREASEQMWSTRTLERIPTTRLRVIPCCTKTNNSSRRSIWRIFRRKRSCVTRSNNKKDFFWNNTLRKSRKSFY